MVAEGRGMAAEIAKVCYWRQVVQFSCTVQVYDGRLPGCTIAFGASRLWPESAHAATYVPPTVSQ